MIKSGNKYIYKMSISSNAIILFNKTSCKNQSHFQQNLSSENF